MKKIWIIPTALCIISLFVLFKPAGKITFDKSVSKNRILFQYEIYGCGSIVGKVIDGGEEIVADYVDEYPDIGTNEVIFTNDSDEPKKHMDEVEFHCGGLAEKYTYVIEGHPVGVTKGALDCCEPIPAYNENVVEFKVDKWYFTSYVPYIVVGNFGVILFAFVVILFSLLWIFLLAIFVIVKLIRNKKIINPRI